jgi:hypothetical protein
LRIVRSYTTESSATTLAPKSVFAAGGDDGSAVPDGWTWD